MTVQLASLQIPNLCRTDTADCNVGLRICEHDCAVDRVSQSCIRKSANLPESLDTAVVTVVAIELDLRRESSAREGRSGIKK